MSIEKKIAIAWLYFLVFLASVFVSKEVALGNFYAKIFAVSFVVGAYLVFTLYCIIIVIYEK